MRTRTNPAESIGRLLENKPWLRKIVLSFLFGRLFQRYYTNLAARASLQLRQESKKCKTIQDYVDLSFNFAGTSLVSIAPAQIREEIIDLLEIVTRSKVNRVLEIGTAKGGTLFLLARVSSPDATIVSIDLPQGRGGGGWYPDWKIPFYRSFAIGPQQLHLVRANSHAASTLHTVERILGEHELGFLFIDGDHTYEGVREDFCMYSPLVRKGGIIAFHDICVKSSEPFGGTGRFWDEIKHAYSYQEIVANPAQKSFGIGLLRL